MSTQHNDGGPAFPGTVWRNVIGDSPLDPVHQANGMSLRDYFAAHAPKQIDDDSMSFQSAAHFAQVCGLSVPDATANSGVAWADFWMACETALRYRYADAMLRAREAKP